MADIEAHIDFAAGPKRVGTLHRHARRGGEAISFEYHPAWLEDHACFSLKPALALGRGAFVPAGNLPVFGSIGDSAISAEGIPPRNEFSAPSFALCSSLEPASGKKLPSTPEDAMWTHLLEFEFFASVR